MLLSYLIDDNVSQHSKRACLASHERPTGDASQQFIKYILEIKIAGYYLLVMTVKPYNMITLKGIEVSEIVTSTGLRLYRR